MEQKTVEIESELSLTLLFLQLHGSLIQSCLAVRLDTGICMLVFIIAADPLLVSNWLISLLLLNDTGDNSVDDNLALILCARHVPDPLPMVTKNCN